MLQEDGSAFSSTPGDCRKRKAGSSSPPQRLLQTAAPALLQGAAGPGGKQSGECCVREDSPDSAAPRLSFLPHTPGSVASHGEPL